MNFLAFSSQPVAGAAGIVSRVQLPAAGRILISHPELRGGRALPAPLAAAGSHNHQRDAMTLQRAQHRAQCRAACMSKANF